MTITVEEFFDRISAEPHPVLHDITATLRVDVTEPGKTTHWYLEIDRGKVAVSQRDEPADAVMGTNLDLFERLITGRANAVAATLRGQVRVEGDPSLLVALQAVLPSYVPNEPATASTKEGH